MFEPVLKQLVDFDRQIVILSNWRPTEGPPGFVVEFEPAITRDDYAEQWDGVMAKIWHSAGNQGPPPSSLKFSDDRREITRFVCEERGDHFLVHFTARDREYFERDRHKHDLPADYLDAIYKAIPRHPFWDDPDVYKGVQVLVD